MHILKVGFSTFRGAGFSCLQPGGFYGIIAPLIMLTIGGNSHADEKKEESANMKNGLNFARKVLATSECDLLVLDEILGVVDAGVISVEELCAIIRAKTEETDVILTGRRLPEELREIADEVYNIIAEK